MMLAPLLGSALGTSKATSLESSSWQCSHRFVFSLFCQLDSLASVGELDTSLVSSFNLRMQVAYLCLKGSQAQLFHVVGFILVFRHTCCLACL